MIFSVSDLEILRDIGDNITRRDRLSEELSELRRLQNDTTADIERVRQDGFLTRRHIPKGRVPKRVRGVDHEGDQMENCVVDEMEDGEEVEEETFVEATRKRARK